MTRATLSYWNAGSVKATIRRFVLATTTVGSSVITEYQVRAGCGVLVMQPQMNFVNDGPGKPVGVNQFIHHDDAEREYAYDRDATFGRLARGLDEAAARGWVVVSMRDDWARIFAHDA